MRNVYVIARNEVLQRFRSRAFRLSVLLLAIVVVGAISVPRYLGDDSPLRIATAGASGQELARVLEGKDNSSRRIEARVYPDAQSAREATDRGEVDAALVDADHLLLGSEATPSEVVPAVERARFSVIVVSNLQARGLSAEQTAQALAVSPAQLEHVGASDEFSEARTLIVLIVLMVLLFLFMNTAVTLANSIVQEKSGRIVEILMVAVRPWELLAGKLVAFGVVGLVQLVVVAMAAWVSVLVVWRDHPLPPGLGPLMAVTAVSYLMGYLFFGAVSAALSARVSRMEDVSSALTPVTVLTILGYAGAFLASDYPRSGWATALSLAPPFSCFVVPVQLAAGHSLSWQFPVAAAFMMLAAAGVVAIASRVYDRAVRGVRGREEKHPRTVLFSRHGGSRA